MRVHRCGSGGKGAVGIVHGSTCGARKRYMGRMCKLCVDMCGGRVSPCVAAGTRRAGGLIVWRLLCGLCVSRLSCAWRLVAGSERAYIGAACVRAS